jgi:hypothetical protein
MRGRSMAVWALSALSCVGFASVASAASHPQERRGFWIGFGAGVGSAHSTCDECDGGGRETAPAGYLKLGGTLSERLLFGGDFNFWSKEQDGVTLNLYNAAATLTLYPAPASGFFIKGGLGVALMDTQFREGSTTITVDPGGGVGLLAGTGYDIRVGRNISITPAVNYWYGWAGDLAFGGELSTNWKHNVVDFTVGITFH